MVSNVKLTPTGKVRNNALIRLIAERTGYHVYEVEDVFSGTISCIKELLEDGHVLQLDSFLNLQLKHIPARLYKNPNNHSETILGSEGLALQVKASDGYRAELKRMAVSYRERQENKRKSGTAGQTEAEDS